jgi:hypothetical protein
MKIQRYGLRRGVEYVFEAVLTQKAEGDGLILSILRRID